MLGTKHVSTQHVGGGGDGGGGGAGGGGGGAPGGGGDGGDGGGGGAQTGVTSEHDRGHAAISLLMRSNVTTG